MGFGHGTDPSTWTSLRDQLLICGGIFVGVGSFVIYGLVKLAHRLTAKKAAVQAAAYRVIKNQQG